MWRSSADKSRADSQTFASYKWCVVFIILYQKPPKAQTSAKLHVKKWCFSPLICPNLYGFVLGPMLHPSNKLVKIGRVVVALSRFQTDRRNQPKHKEQNDKNKSSPLFLGYNHCLTAPPVSLPVVFLSRAAVCIMFSSSGGNVQLWIRRTTCFTL